MGDRGVHGVERRLHRPDPRLDPERGPGGPRAGVHPRDGEFAQRLRARPDTGPDVRWNARYFAPSGGLRPRSYSAHEHSAFVPDATLERVERLAQRDGMNRSRYTLAADRLAAQLEAADLTAAIDAALDAAASQGGDLSTEFTAAAARRVLNDGDEEW